MFLRSAEFASEPHPAPSQQWVVMLRGVIEVEVSDGTRRRFAPGDLLFVADTTGRGHVTFASGDPAIEALFIRRP
jgi:quercetin dioxygenase-like cupin family protein